MIRSIRGGNGRPRGKSWSLGCNVVGHASRRGQHEAGAVPEFERKEHNVGFLDLRNTTSWRFMKQDLPNLNDSHIYEGSIL
jgi:hypothetical protein